VMTGETKAFTSVTVRLRVKSGYFANNV